MGAAQVWRRVRSELLGLVVVGFIVFALPHLIDSLSHFHVQDVLGFAAVWFAVALIRTGIGVLWRRRSKKDRYALEESTVNRSSR
ncbi:hypothetical protein [Oryzihumus leptocrescens]|uniref:Uncharacterized protein n=1 Tax=Oryzihumus leptocrescens TaxID=297536 RepID=A0A542ZEE5_9MICO|nr:hypothetical protein [Oryzihumus leptocrescens]TQL58677.1 hypothetical protein FB474_0011 [Oryzihumus leptocrescens]